MNIRRSGHQLHDCRVCKTIDCDNLVQLMQRWAASHPTWLVDVESDRCLVVSAIARCRRKIYLFLYYPSESSVCVSVYCC
eukprot:m.130148 g.130148  ORF g.130148 m.130148 type:complete len:80 (+) comp29460_c7_seq1:73-312(+)